MKRIWPSRSRAHLGGLRLLDLDDQVGGREQRIDVGLDAGTRRGVFGVGDAHAGAGSGLNDDRVARAGELAHAARGHPHPIFVALDLGRNTDPHAVTPSRASLRPKIQRMKRGTS